MVSVIQTENLTKHYRDTHAVEHVNLDVEQGEIYGFLVLGGFVGTLAWWKRADQH